MSKLFTPTICLAGVKNRVVMAPMTRTRTMNDVPDGSWLCTMHSVLLLACSSPKGCRFQKKAGVTLYPRYLQRRTRPGAGVR